jgi:two-component system response regulator YesN
VFKLLVVDDEPWSRQVVRALGAWETLDLEIVGEAEDGAAALRLIEELQPHIVLTDMRMPGIDGVELLKRFSESYPAIRLIVMSGYQDIEYLRQSIRSRAIEYLLKPIDPEELNAALAQCVRELEQARIARHVSWSTMHVFADKRLLDRYLALKQQIYQHLIDYNTAAVGDSFAALGEFMNVSFGNALDGSLVSQIGHEFILMLEQYMTDHGIGLEQLWHQENREGTVRIAWDSMSSALDDLRRFYSIAMHQVISARRNSSRLNISAVRAYIDGHYQDQISLDSIAKHFYVSKEYLSRLFKSETGENVSARITRKRMERARELILDQGLTTRSAAQLAGYEDLAYFYKVFKLHFGHTPGDLRADR